MVGRLARRYSLGMVRALVLEDRYAVTRRVHRYLAAQSWDCDLVAECLCALRTSDLYKSVPDSHRPGSHLDSYRPWCRGRRLYVKFTLDEDGDLYVVSFCRDGEDH
ncbi:MAG: type II toxin-antitoxin system MqsR family toxin [Coriobacteriia bacterium]|nr:type II toxin-antitoxin system MqsR family toxin [Coriobacteriia bacterium]